MLVAEEGGWPPGLRRVTLIPKESFSAASWCPPHHRESEAAFIAQRDETAEGNEVGCVCCVLVVLPFFLP